MTEVIKIPYPKTMAGKKEWNKRYSLNAYWRGKPYHERAADARFWHALTKMAMDAAHCRKHPFENPVEIVIYWDDALDVDNHAAMGKMIVDAMKGRVIRDDSRKWLKRLTHDWNEDGIIRVVVSEVEHDRKG